MLMSGGNSPEHLTQCPHHALFSHQNSWCHDSNPALFFLPCVTYQAENTGHQRANRESLGLSPFLSPNHPYSKWNEETDLNFHEVSQVLERQKWTKLPSASVTVGGLSGPARLVADVCLFLPSVLVCKEINLLSSIQWCEECLLQGGSLSNGHRLTCHAANLWKQKPYFKKKFSLLRILEGKFIFQLWLCQFPQMYSNVLEECNCSVMTQHWIRLHFNGNNKNRNLPLAAAHRGWGAFVLILKKPGSPSRMAWRAHIREQGSC